MNDRQDEVEQDDTIIRTALIGSLIVFALVGGIGYGVFHWMQEDVAELTNAPEPVILPVSPSIAHISLPKIPWTDITQEAGIDFVHENGAQGEKLLPETMGGGCAFFDYDRDGDQDLFLVNSRRWPNDPREDDPDLRSRLYANDGTGQFSDVTDRAGLNLVAYGMGVACGDYDNDGWVDLFVSCVGKDHLLRNVEGKFTDVTETAGVSGTESDWSSSAGWFDYDRDGDLDLFVCHYLQWTPAFDKSQDFQLIGGGRAYGRPQSFGGTSSSLFRNDGGTFVDVSKAAGLEVLNRDTNVPMGKSLGVVFDDYNRDGWPDVLISNDTVQNFLFLNQKDGTFQEVGALSGVAFDINGGARGAMGIDSAHFRNDESIGVAIGNFSNEMTALYVTPSSNLQFYDEAVANGLGPSTRLQLSFGVLFLDADLDGRLDLFQANGHLEQEISKVQASQTYAQAPQLFWNAGAEQNLEFIALGTAELGQDFLRPLVGRGSTYADIDADGDLDLLITASGGRPRLLRNELDLNQHWLRVKLVGKANAVNRDAIGARVSIETAAGTQTRQVSPTRSYLSQVELPVTFGLGEETKISSLTIRWPDGTAQIIEQPEVDRLLVVEQE